MASRQSPRGVRLLVDKGDTGKELLPFGAFLLFLAVNCVGLFVASWPDEEWPALVVSILGGFLTLVMAWRYKRHLLVWLRFHPGELEVSPWPLKMGETARLRYRRRCKAKAAVRLVTGSLACVESATYMEGTISTTATETIFQCSLESVPDPVPDHEGVVSAEWQAQIPAEGPPTFRSPNNKVEWIVTARLNMETWPNDKSEFTLGVIPERAP